MQIFVATEIKLGEICELDSYQLNNDQVLSSLCLKPLSLCNAKNEKDGHLKLIRSKCTNRPL